MKKFPTLPKLNNQRDFQDLLNLFPKDDLIRSSFEKRVVDFFAPGLLKEIAADQEEEDQPDTSGKPGVKKRKGVKFNVKPETKVEPKVSTTPQIAPVEAMGDYGDFKPLAIDEVLSQAKPVEAKPVTPVEAKPVTPVEAKPVTPVEAKPVEAKPVEAKPVEAKPVEAKPVEAIIPDRDESSNKTNDRSTQKHAFVPKVDKSSSEKGIDLSLVIKKIDVVIETLNKINKSIGYLAVPQDGVGIPGIEIPDINIQRPGTVPVGGPGSTKPTSTKPPKQSMGSKAFNAIKGVGLKGVGILGVAGAVAGGVYEGYTGWKDASDEAKSEVAAIDEKIKSGEITPEEGKQLQKSILAKESEQKTSAVVGGTGAAGGALLGGAAGAALGTALFPGVGTVAGGLIGGTVGAIAGSDVGKAAGKYGAKAYNSITGFFSEKNKSTESKVESTKSDKETVTNFSESSFAEKDPENYKKYVEYRDQQYEKYLKDNPPKTDSIQSKTAAKNIARIQAKQMAIEKFKTEINSVGAGSTISNKVESKTESEKSTVQDKNTTNNVSTATSDLKTESTKTDLTKATTNNVSTATSDLKTESKVIEKKLENSEKSSQASFSEATFAEKDPENYKKYVEYRDQQYQKYLQENPPKGDATQSKLAASNIARISAKQMAVEKFKIEIEAAGAGKTEVSPAKKIESAQTADKGVDTKLSATSKDASPVSQTIEAKPTQEASVSQANVAPKVEPTASSQPGEYKLAAANKPGAALDAKQKQPTGVEIDNISKQNFDMSKSNQTQIVQPIISNTSTSTNTQSMVPIKAQVRYESSYSRLMDRNYMR